MSNKVLQLQGCEMKGSTFQGRKFSFSGRDISSDSFNYKIKSNSKSLIKTIEGEKIGSDVIFPFSELETLQIGNYTIEYWAVLEGIGTEIIAYENFRISGSPCNIDYSKENTFALNFVNETINYEMSIAVINIGGGNGSGINGKSAYQIAVDEGFIGSEAEWLLSLEGKDFEYSDFTQEQLVLLKGTDGKSAYQIWLDNGNIGTQLQFLESLKGEPGIGSLSASKIKVPTSNNLVDLTTIINNGLNAQTGIVSGVGKHISIKTMLPNKDYFISGIGNNHYDIQGVFYLNGIKQGGQYGYITIIQNSTTLGFRTPPYKFDEFKLVLKSSSGTDNTDINQVMLNEGTSALPYESFTSYDAVKKIDNTVLSAKLNFEIAENDFDSVNVAAMKLNSVWKKKFKTVFIGDSITYAGNGWTKTYKELMSPTLAVNYAVNGSRITTTGSTQLQGQINSAIANNPEIDIVIIAHGTNDYGVTLGTISTAFEKPIAELGVMNMAEAFRLGIYTLKNAFPNVKVFYSMPIQRATPPKPYSDTVINQNEMMRNLCRLMGVTLIDSFTESGILAEFETNGSIGRDLSDGLHTNDSGGIKLGRCIAKKVFLETSIDLKV